MNVILLNNNTVKKALLRVALFLIIEGLAFSRNNDNNDTAYSDVSKKLLVKNYAKIAMRIIKKRPKIVLNNDQLFYSRKWLEFISL